MKRSKTLLTKAAALLFASLFSLTGARAQQTVPYEYGFEDNNLSTDGWVLYGSTQTTGNMATGINTTATNSSIAHSGTYGFRFRYNDAAYLMSPVFNDGWCVDVSFWYKESSLQDGSGNFQVGYTTDASVTDPRNFTYGDVIIASSAEFVQYTNTFPAETKRIAIKHINVDAYYLCRDDFVFTPLTISGNQEFDESTHVTITCNAEGATIMYSTDDGVSWKTYPAGGFDLTETTTVTAKATKAGLPDSPEVSKCFFHSDDGATFDWNLKTNPSSYTIVTGTTRVDWVCEGATMTLAKGTSQTNANNYLGGTQQGNQTYDHTRMYSGQTLTFAPIKGFMITSIEMTATSNNEGNRLNSRMTLSNATKTHTNNTTKVTITPTDGSVPVVATFSNTVQVAGVNVTYHRTSSPFIAVAVIDEAINATSAAVPTTTLNTVYNDVDDSDAAAVLCDEAGNAASYSWIHVSLNGENKLTYSIDANTNTETTEPRIAYMKVTAGGYSSPVIKVTQDAPVIVTIGTLGYSTLFYGTLNLVVPDGVTAYTYKLGTPKPVISTTYNAGDVIPASSAVVLKTDTPPTTATKYAFVESATADERDGYNALQGSDEGGMTVGKDEEDLFYALSHKGGKNVGFYWMADNGAAFNCPAHKAYLAVPVSSNPVKSFFFDDDDDPTGIENVNVNLNDNEAIYNVAGQRINKIQKGINIVNGKKILK